MRVAVTGSIATDHLMTFGGKFADSLVVSAGAVEKHISSIFTKLDLPPSEHEHRRVLAVLRYLG